MRVVAFSSARYRVHCNPDNHNSTDNAQGTHGTSSFYLEEDYQRQKNWHNVPTSGLLQLEPNQPTTPASSTVVGDVEWSGQVRVLVMACSSYTTRLAMPSAMSHVAIRAAHWCTQLLYDSEQVALRDHPEVDLLFDDAVTSAAVGEFLLRCAAERAAPLMLYYGLVEHVEGCFGDLALHVLRDAEWPAGCKQWVAQRPTATESSVLVTPRTSSVKARPASSGKARHYHKGVATLPPNLNPLTARGTSAPTQDTSTAWSDRMSLHSIDAVCAGLKLPHPVIIMDCCFGPLVLKTSCMTVLHPSRIASGSPSAALQFQEAIPSGSTVHAFTQFVETMIQEHKSNHTTSISWSHVLQQLHRDSDVGTTAQQLFSHHIADDIKRQPFLVTAPRDLCKKPLISPLQSAYVGLLHLPHDASAPATNATATSQTIWFPVGATVVEMHKLNDNVHPAPQDIDNVLEQATSQISQTFALRLHPRHNVHRMCSEGRQLHLAEALRSVLALDGSTSSLSGINFNISVGLSGHVIVFISSEHQQTVRDAASVLIEHRERLSSTYSFVDWGFVVARQLEAPLSYIDALQCRGNVITLDVHVGNNR